METISCKADHDQHICALAEQQKYGEIKVLAADPGYICTNCGRVSNQEKSLCAALPFEMIDPGIPLE